MGQRRLSLLAFIALVGLVVLGTVGCDGSPVDENLATTSAPIIGGAFAGVCEWPTTVMSPSAGCSGTLVHPRVITMAKHCLGTTPASVSFGETRTKFVKTVKIAKCFKYPSDDFGFCTLAEDVTGVPIVPVMAPCEMAPYLKVDAPIVEAGFGDQAPSNNAPWGTKKWIAGKVVRGGATRNEVDVTAGTQDGEYFGDSGGPVFLNMPDGTWRLIGNDFSSPDWNSSGKPRISTYTSVPFHVAWAEQQSGIDITPCHDAAGGWNPGPDCVGAPTNPGTGVGTWDTLCAGQTMLVSPTCNGSDGDGGILTDAGPRPIADAGGDARTDGGSTGTGGGTGGKTDAHGDDTGNGTSKDSGPGASSGSGGATGSGGARAGTGGSGAPIGSGGAPGAADSGVSGGGESNGGGCSCETGPRGSAPATSLLMVLAGACVGGLRRRRKRGPA